MLTTGQAADSPQFIPVLKKVRVRGPVGRPRIRPDAVAGDKAYSSRGNRAHLRIAETAPTCANTVSRRSSRRRRTRPPTGRRRAPEVADPSATTPVSTRSGTASNA
nr:hypothetical protein [Streptomyces triticiradicis]